MSTNTFDTIVVGLGAMGSAALYQLSKRGASVLGIDQFSPPHDRGSSHGDTRLTRLAIGEGRHYVPLAVRSHEIWRELEAATGDTLLEEVGGVFFSGRKQGSPVHGAIDFIGETVTAAEAHGIEHEILEHDDLVARFPQFRYHGVERGYYESRAGFVRPERCIAAQLRLADGQGATIHRDENVTQVEALGPDKVRVTSETGVYEARQVILSVGAWTRRFLAPSLGELFSVYRQLLFWFDVEGDIARFEPEHFPVFIRTDRTKEDLIYGFPAVDGPDGGLKIASEQYQATCEPEVGTGPVTAKEIEAMYALTSRFLRIEERCQRAAACLFTVTPDGEFVIDRHPEHPALILASPCSGHGFKHSAAIGEMLAEMALDGESKLDRQPFSISRFD